jgi:ABC-type phosphate/phosphonate transport system substrate-binding protein
LAAVAQGCGKLVFKLTDSEGNFGVKADIIARQGGNPSVNTLRDLRGRDFCRLSGTDIQSWILPMLSMRTGGVNPAAELKGIKEYGSVEMMVQGVADGICGGAGIPAGTLSTYKPRITTGQLIVLTTTPELPYGGLLISNTVPSALSDQLVKLIKDNPASLSSVLGTSKLVDAKPDDFSDFLRFADNAGLNLKTMQ